MPAAKLTIDQIKSIQQTLLDARAGRATLVQLARAHDLAVDAVDAGTPMNGTVGELRMHIHNLAPEPVGRAFSSELVRDTVTGTVAGIVIYYILKGIDRRAA